MKIEALCSSDKLVAFRRSSRQYARGSIVVKALGYKLQGCGFETRWGEISNLVNPSGRTRPVRGTGNLTAIYEPIV
jgi:hypothetical protein